MLAPAAGAGEPRSPRHPPCLRHGAAWSGQAPCRCDRRAPSSATSATSRASSRHEREARDPALPRPRAGRCAPAASLGDVGLVRADVARASADPGDAVRAGAAVDAFGLEVYRAIVSGQTNLVFSPASITLALAMARAGARGATASEMDTVMHSAAADDHAGWLNALDQALATRSGIFRDEGGEDAQITLRIANAPFAQLGMPLEKPYLEALAERFGGGLRLVDYETQTEQARAMINSWVDAQTEHRIPELLVPSVLTRATRLALVNAVYLKAPWQTPFSVDATTGGTFTRADGSAVQVPFMAATTSLRYASGSDWRAVEIPYVGGSLALMVIVPDDLATFESTLRPLPSPRSRARSARPRWRWRSRSSGSRPRRTSPRSWRPSACRRRSTTGRTSAGSRPPSRCRSRT